MATDTDAAAATADDDAICVCLGSLTWQLLVPRPPAASASFEFPQTPSSSLSIIAPSRSSSYFSWT